MKSSNKKNNTQGLDKLPTYEPRPDFWNTIESELNKEDKKKGFFLYWKFGLAASIVLLIGIFTYLANSGITGQMESETAKQINADQYQTDVTVIDNDTQQESLRYQAQHPSQEPEPTNENQESVPTDQPTPPPGIPVPSTENTYYWSYGDQQMFSDNDGVDLVLDGNTTSPGTYRSDANSYSFKVQDGLTTANARNGSSTDQNFRLGILPDLYSNEDLKPYSPGEIGNNRKPKKALSNTFADTISIGYFDVNKPDPYDSHDESYAPLVENQFLLPSEEPLSTFGIDVDNASYAIMRNKINMGFIVPKDAVRVEEFINYFKYNYPQPQKGQPFSVNLEMAACPWNSEHKLARIGLKGRDIDPTEKNYSNLVFLIDVSGSMEDENKLPLVKKSMKLLVDQMGGNDRIAIVTYAGAAGLALASTPCNEKEYIKKKIDKLDAGGSTAGGEGIKLAYEVAFKNRILDGNNRVILCTDGDFNVGANSDQDMKTLIVENRNQDIFITVCGFGMGNLKDSKMETIADNGNGNYFYVDTYKESTRVFERDLRSTLFTIAKDVKIQVEFNPSQVKAYRLIGYENRLMPSQDFNDDTKDGGELGAGHTVTALYEIIPAGSSEEIPGRTQLKYQMPDPVTKTDFKDEVLTVKLRYKEPKGTVSKLISTSLLNSNTPFDQATKDFRFCAGVSLYAQQLRQSQYISDRSFSNTAKMIETIVGGDANDDQTELIQLIREANTLYQEQADR